MNMNCTCLKPEFEDMTLQRTIGVEIREDEWGLILAWRIAEPQIRDNMTIEGSGRMHLFILS